MLDSSKIGQTDYDFTDYQTIHPDKITRRTQVRKRIISRVNEKGELCENGGFYQYVPAKVKRQTVVKVERSFHNFEISRNSKKNIESKCNWLWRLAKSRTVTTYTGKKIYNFRNSFLTFTLPSVQAHPTSEIMRECWERLLTQFRNVLKMENYVWKLEFQSAGNVHFHLITDTYIDYFYARKAWNVIIDKLGYVQAYHDKFASMSFNEYRQMFSGDKQKEIQKLASWYEQGRRTKWMNPNSVDVRNVTTEKAMGYYLSKYIGKSGKSGGNPTYDNEGNSFGLRLAFWSRSLSRCQAVSMPVDFFEFDVENVYKTLNGFVKKVYDYCKVYYYRISEMTDTGKRYFYDYFRRIRQEFDFVPAT